ncbi:MAG TPA: PhnD/SsuA/transferrin family substrate-binding protein [Oscillatoriaceae cyanobacterium]
MALRLVNLQSEVTAPFLAAVANCLTRHAGIPVDFVNHGDWIERREALLQGEADLALWCGLPYALEADRAEPRVALVATPVMAAERYEGAPVYFSDVVVKRQARWRHFVELEGASWAYNEPSSHSGYWLTRYELARRKLPSPFFGRVLEAGSHMAAIELVRRGVVDASAIDSSVLELARAADPALAMELRVLEAWGPSPAPPLVASTRLPAGQLQRLTQALLGMHASADGRAALAVGQVARFAAVTDADYDRLRRMAAIGAGAHLIEA